MAHFVANRCHTPSCPACSPTYHDRLPDGNQTGRGADLRPLPHPGPATSISGSSTPAVVHPLIHVTGNQASSVPGFWIAVARGLRGDTHLTPPEAEVADRASPTIHPIPLGGMVPYPLPHQ
jgi:hypothetical protein